MQLPGLFLGAVNLIPLSMDGVANDGFNLHLLSRSPQARRTFALQLRCHALLQRGIPLRDQPACWFQLPQDLEPRTPLPPPPYPSSPAGSWTRGTCPGRKPLSEPCWTSPLGLLDIQRWDLTVDLLSCSLLLGRSQEELAPLRTPALLHYCKATRKFTPSTSRMEFLWALLAQRDRRPPCCPGVSSSAVRPAGPIPPPWTRTAA